MRVYYKTVRVTTVKGSRVQVQRFFIFIVTLTVQLESAKAYYNDYVRMYTILYMYYIHYTVYVHNTYSILYIYYCTVIMVGAFVLRFIQCKY